jgi:hypothetical protein
MNLSVRSQDSVVGIVTGYVLDDRGVGIRVSMGSRFSSRPALGSTQPLLSSGYRGLLGGKAARACS